MHCCDSYAVRRESRERWDFNYKDYSFASLLKAKTVAVINRVTWSQATNKNFSKSRLEEFTIFNRHENRKTGLTILLLSKEEAPHQILLVRICSIFHWKIFTIFFSSNCFGHKLGSTEPTAIWRIFPRSSFNQIFTIFYVKLFWSQNLPQFDEFLIRKISQIFSRVIIVLVTGNYTIFFVKIFWS